MADAPYFSFWAKDWLTGEGTRLMTAEQKGAFIDLLSHAWLSGTEPCTLPADDASLAKLSGLGRRWKANAAKIRAQFEVTDSGRLSNVRLKSVFTSMEVAHANRVSAGAKGGHAKAERHTAKAVRAKSTPAPKPSNATAMPEQCSSNQSQNQRTTTDSYPAAVYDWLAGEWLAKVGKPPKLFRADVKPLLSAGVRPGQLSRAFTAYADDLAARRKAGKQAAGKFAWFLDDLTAHVHEGDLCAIQLMPPDAFGLTQAEVNEKIAEHQDRLAMQDAALYERIVTGQAAA